MFSLFRRKLISIRLEDQLRTLIDCGAAVNPQANLEDLFIHHQRSIYEASPYKELIPVLGLEMEREPFAPLCPSLWMCDYERIDEHGSYANLIMRLDQLSGHCLGISNLTDFVDVEAKIAWVEFIAAGSRIHWDAKVEDDWLDAYIIVKFDQLLKAHSERRIYSNHTDFGQCAFFASLTPAQFERFQPLATFSLRLIEDQA